MSSITEIWTKSKETFNLKSLSQILAFAGDGKLKDNNITSKEFRDLLDQVPSSLLKQFAGNCLTDGFTDSGLALQDIINQIGARLGFSIEHGAYRGNQKNIGFDGIWTSTERHSLVVEVKTTDAYRINLDTIAEYRRELIEQNRIDKIHSSILIVVGRKDTGDLEAQIRGSQHAWDMRLVSSDSLLKLLSLKEALNDSRIIQQINELLKPREYTRIDKLIELIFLTSKDLQLEEQTEEDLEEIEDLSTEKKKRNSSKERVTPVTFREKCVTRIAAKLNVNFIKQAKVSYSNKDKTTGITCAISKTHKQGQKEKFWFAFHPHQNIFLKAITNAYVAFGCGSPDELFLIPYNEFQPLIKNFGTTNNEDRMYWHIVIYNRSGSYLLAQPQIKKGATVDITKYKVSK